MGRAFLIRWLAALVLVLATFNPTSLNYVNWARENWSTSTPMVALVGLILFVCFIIFFRGGRDRPCRSAVCRHALGAVGHGHHQL